MSRSSAALPVVENSGGQPYALPWVADNGEAYGLALDEMLQATDVARHWTSPRTPAFRSRTSLAADSHGPIGWTIAGALLSPRPPAATLRAFLRRRGLAPARRAARRPRASCRSSTTPSTASSGRPTPAPMRPRPRAVGRRSTWPSATAATTSAPVRSRSATASKATPSSTRRRWARSSSTTRRCSCARGPAASQRSPPARLAARDHPAARRLERPRRRRPGRLSPGQRGAQARAGGLVDGLEPAADQAGQCPARAFDWHARFEYAAADALDKQPAHLLPPGFASWDAFLLAHVDADRRRHDAQRRPPARAGDLGRGQPKPRRPRAVACAAGLARVLDMPSVPQSGDRNMPHVAAPAFGQSERLVVAPGHEERATLSCPAARAAIRCRPTTAPGMTTGSRPAPTPLLAGPAQHALTFPPPVELTRGPGLSSSRGWGRYLQESPRSGG